MFVYFLQTIREPENARYRLRIFLRLPLHTYNQLRFSDYRSGLTSGFISNTDEGFHLVLRDDTTILTDISSISILVNTSTTTARIYTGNMTQTLGLASAVGELKRDGEGDDG